MPVEKMSIAEQEFHLPEYDFIKEGVEDFAEIMIQV